MKLNRIMMILLKASSFGFLSAMNPPIPQQQMTIADQINFLNYLMGANPSNYLTNFS